MLLGFSYVGNQNGREKCHCCGTNKSVKYRATVLEPGKGLCFDVYMCNKCVALNIAEGIKET